MAHAGGTPRHLLFRVTGGVSVGCFEHATTAAGWITTHLDRIGETAYWLRRGKSLVAWAAAAHALAAHMRAVRSHGFAWHAPLYTFLARPCPIRSSVVLRSFNPICTRIKLMPEVSANDFSSA